MPRVLLDVGRGFREAGQPFARGLIAIADRMGLDPSYIAAVIAFESAFNPAAVNPLSGASGLIQWLRSTAQQIHGTTVEAIRQMTREQQLPLVEQYYRAVGVSRIRDDSPADHYMAVFSPNFIGRPLDSVAYAAGSKAYEQNKAMDRGRKGFISVADIAAPVEGIVNAARGRPAYVVQDADAPPFPGPAPGAPPINVAGGVGVVVIAGLLIGSAIYARRIGQWIS